MTFLAMKDYCQENQNCVDTEDYYVEIPANLT